MQVGNRTHVHHGEDTGSSGVAEEYSIKVQGITPRYPETDTEMVQLEEDLARMGCLNLLRRPWGLKSEYMIKEVRMGAPYIFQTTLRARPNQWTAIRWRQVYAVGTEGKGLCTRGEDYSTGKFEHPIHSKDGYLTADCKDPRARRVLEFLIPILLPEKGTRVTVGVASTILGSFSGERIVD